MGYVIDSMYGIDDDIMSCLKCHNTNLLPDIMKSSLNDIGETPNWYCEKCKTVWVKGLLKPRYNEKK